MKTLQSLEEYKELSESGKTIFLFSADWCPDCRVIEPFLPELEEKYASYQFVYVDRDDFIELCGDLGVFGIPSFVAFHDNEEVGRFVGKERKTRDQIENFIEGLSA